MDIQQKLDPTSPIVQRVFLLRERIARQDAMTTDVLSKGYSASSEITDTKDSYQWQMWQKSDLSAYAGNDFEHRCK